MHAIQLDHRRKTQVLEHKRLGPLRGVFLVYVLRFPTLCSVPLRTESGAIVVPRLKGVFRG